MIFEKMKKLRCENVKMIVIFTELVKVHLTI